MQIKVKAGKWASARCTQKMQKVANHIASHYPKDSALHKAFREAWAATNESGTKTWKKTATKKAAPKRRTVKRKTTAKRRTSAKSKTTPKRRTTKRTARKTTPKRRVMRRTARRTVRRRAA